MPDTELFKKGDQLVMLFNGEEWIARFVRDDGIRIDLKYGSIMVVEFALLGLLHQKEDRG